MQHCTGKHAKSPLENASTAQGSSPLEECTTSLPQQAGCATELAGEVPAWVTSKRTPRTHRLRHRKVRVSATEAEDHTVERTGKAESNEAASAQAAAERCSMQGPATPVLADRQADLCNPASPSADLQPAVHGSASLPMPDVVLLANTANLNHGAQQFAHGEASSAAGQHRAHMQSMQLVASQIVHVPDMTAHCTFRLVESCSGQHRIWWLADDG